MSTVCVGGHWCIGLWSVEGNVYALYAYICICTYMHLIYILKYHFYILKRARAESERFASVVCSTSPHSVTVYKVDSEFSSVLSVSSLMN